MASLEVKEQKGMLSNMVQSMAASTLEQIGSQLNGNDPGKASGEFRKYHLKKKIP